MKVDKNRILSVLSFFLISLFITWYTVFESPFLASKIDTHIHLFRVQNLLESFQQGTLFPSWHDSPYWGYPEDFNFYFSYFLLMITGLVLPIVWAFKLFYFIFYFFAGVAAQWSFQKFIGDRFTSFLAALLYMGSASFANFALGSGSPPRVAAIVLFPIMLGAFISFWKEPNRKNAALFCLSFFLSYTAHPIAAMAGCLCLCFTPIYGHPEGQIKNILKTTWPVFLLGATSFSWYLIQLLLMKKALSWDDVYQFYSQFKVTFGFRSFFFFWMNNNERMQSFYMGSIPLLISLIAPFFILKKAKLEKIFLYFMALTLFSFFVILFGQDIFQRNTFRLDLIYNFALAGMCAYLLNHLKWKQVAFAIVVLIIFEQTQFFRHFGGMSYIGETLVKDFKNKYGEKLNHKRTLIDEEQPHMVITDHQYARLSTSDWIEFHGVLEITPYNLGLIPFIHKIGQYESLYQFLGVARMNESEPPQTQVYREYKYAEASNRREAWEKLYLPQLENSDFYAHATPIVFVETKRGSPRLVNSTYKPLTIIREAFHPRRIVLTQEEEIDIFPVEPGLIGTYSSKTDFKVGSHFLMVEKLAGLVTLTSFILLLFILATKKRFHS